MKFLVAAVLSGLVLASSLLAREPGFGEYRVVQESLSRVHPRMRASWLKERGIEDPYYTSVRTDSGSGLQCIGRWSYGPSYDVDGRVTASETLVALARGSGVSLLRFSRQDSLSIELLSDINAEGLMCRVKVVDTLLYVGSRKGLEVYNIANEQNPVRRSWIPLPLNDFDVQDSLAYTISGDNSFRIYNVSNPASPVLRGACTDSGDLVSVAGHGAFVGDRWGLYIVDVTDPASPHRVGSWGADIQGVQARGSICCVTTDNPNNPGELRFTILDVRTPSSPTPLGSLDGAGGYDTQFDDTLAYVSGYYTGGHEFQILGIGDSLHPHLIGQASTLGYNWGVWGDRRTGRAFVADAAEGLQVFDITTLGSPAHDTTVLAAGYADDIAVRGRLAAVAQDWCGMKLLDVSNPTAPYELSGIDTTYQDPATYAVALGDSFAYAGWIRPPLLRVIDISDSLHPVMAGGCSGAQTLPQDVVLRDTLLYIVGRLRLNIVNVARPREPVLVGSCVTSSYSGYDLAVAGTFAYVAGLPLFVVSLAQPDSPFVAGEFDRGVWGLDVVDTVLYAVGQNAQFWTLSVANPASPRVLDSIHLPSYDGEDVVVIGSTAYASENVIRMIDVSDPSNLRLVGQASVPQWTPRLVYAAPYLYACCAEGGVCVLETLPTGIEEMTGAGQRSGLTILPSVTEGRLVIRGRIPRESPNLAVFDVSGKEVMRATMPAQQGEASGRWPVDLSRLSAGVYVLRLEGKGVTEIGKVVITRRR